MAGFSNIITSTAFFFLASVIAGPVEPGITPAPHVRRDNPDLIGWYADGVVGGSTIWSEESCSTGYTLFSASNYFKCCSTGVACSLYTGCSGSYLLGQNTQVNCPVDLGSLYPSCSSDLLYPSSGALSAETYFWCATFGEIGSYYYAASPTTEATTSTSSTTTTTSPGPIQTQPTPPTPTPPPASSSNAGAIAGGVVGGVALIAIIAGLAAFLIIRNKKRQQLQSSATDPSAGPPPQTDLPAAITTGAVFPGPSEKMGAQSPPPQSYYEQGAPQPTYASHEQSYAQTFSPTVPLYATHEQTAPVPPNVVELESTSPPRPSHLS